MQPDLYDDDQDDETDHLGETQKLLSTAQGKRLSGSSTSGKRHSMKIHPFSGDDSGLFMSSLK